MFEIEPVDVIQNFLQVKINVSISIESNDDNYTSMLENLTMLERDTLLKIVGSERKSINLNMNIETHLFDFLYDCDKNHFVLAKHQKVLSV